LTKFELKVMQRLWRGPCSIREILETFRGSRRPAYTTVQTIVYRLEAKNALKRTRKIGNAHIFKVLVAPQDIQQRKVQSSI
jgi:predicted transcriptional regulator